MDQVEQELVVGVRHLAARPAAGRQFADGLAADGDQLLPQQRGERLVLHGLGGQRAVEGAVDALPAREGRGEQGGDAPAVLGRLDRRAALLPGLALMAAGGALSALAPSYAVLVGARVPAGLGGAVFYPPPRRPAR